jgi:molybdopterin-guanine dinucleotide biosynthesis protein A
MGTDKALLRFGDENLLQVALRKAKAVSGETIIVGEREKYSDYGRVVEDRFPGCGPLGGIHAALSTTETELNLVLSVDMPRMTSEFLVWLVGRAAHANELATVPETDGRSQPLCAIYHRALQPVIEQALEAGEYKVDRIFRQVPTQFISESDLCSAGFSADIFCNVNTPDEYEAAIRRASGIPAETGKGQRV